MNSRPEPAPYQSLIDRLEVHLDPELAILALTHRSFAHEAGGIPTNERLEFLGDSVLGIVVTEHVFRAHPDASEGDLAKMRAASVSQRSLADVARRIGLGPYILSDTVEALIGAVYLTHGMEPTRAMVERLVGPALTRAAGLGAGLDWKTSLQELTAQMGLSVPEYRSEGEGPDHARVFTAWAIVGERTAGTGRGTSKKGAEQLAAADAYRRIEAGGADWDGDVRPPPPVGPPPGARAA